MSAVQFFLPHLTATVAGIAQPGAQFEFLESGTTTPLTVYSDSGLTTPRTNPVVCNGVGALPTTYLDNSKTYRLRILDKSGALLDGGDIDPFIPGTVPDASVLSPYSDAAAASASAAAGSAAAAATSETNAAASEANAAASEAQVASDAAIAAGAAAIMSAATINFTVDASLVVRPENNGGANAVGIAAACSAASAAGGVVALSPGATYTIDREIVVPLGVSIVGPRSATLKRIDQITATVTVGFSSGTGVKTVTVSGANAGSFSVGQSVMWVNTTAHTVQPSDPYTHGGRQITAKVNNGDGTYTYTIAAGGSASSAAGDIMATTCAMLRPQGNNLLQGFTIDGNAANNTYGHWVTSSSIAQEGSEVRVDGVAFQNTPSDAFLCGGPNGGDIYGSTVANSLFTNIGGNGIHYGNVRRVAAINNRMVTGNVRWLLPVEQAGGNNIRSGHQDGAWIYSNDVGEGRCIGNHIEDWICGVGALGSTPISGTIQTNDDTIVALNTFKNCNRPLEVIAGTKRIIFTGNKCVSDFPFASGAMRFVNQQVYAAGDLTQGQIENLVITNNAIKNGQIWIDRVRNFTASGNTIDNRAYNSSSNTTNVYYDILLFNYEGGIVKGNAMQGGCISIYLQQSNVAPCRDTIIEGNICAQPYLRGLSGQWTSPATFTGTIFRNNIVRADTAYTQEDGVTVVSVDGAGSWRGLSNLKGLQLDHNRVEFNNAGAAAFDTSGAAYDAVTAANRRWNVVNGLFELFGNYANDAAAATANVSVGGMYRNGSALQQRAV